jgi:hypothetical protein
MRKLFSALIILLIGMAGLFVYFNSQSSIDDTYSRFLAKSQSDDEGEFDYDEIKEFNHFANK